MSRNLNAGEVMLKLAEYEREAAMQAIAELNENRQKALALMDSIHAELKQLEVQRHAALAQGIQASHLAAYDAAASELLNQQDRLTQTLDELGQQEEGLVRQWLESDGKQKGMTKHVQKQQRQIDKAEARHDQQKMDDMIGQRQQGAKF